MKRFVILLLGLVLFATSVAGQRKTRTDKLEVRTEIKFKTVTIDSISRDTTFTNISHNSIPTSEAVKSYVDQNAGTSEAITTSYDTTGNELTSVNVQDALLETYLVAANKKFLTVPSFVNMISLNLDSSNVVLDGGTGITYNIKEAAVPLAPTSTPYMVALNNGKYAVADLSEKRSFDSKAELNSLIHFCNIKHGEEIYISGTPFEVSYSYKGYQTRLDSIAQRDSKVDGFFVDTVSVHLPHKNLFYFSEDINNAYYGGFPNGAYSTTIFLNGNAGVIPQNAAIAPDGTRTAERLYGFNSTASNQLQLKGNAPALEDGLQIGDSITYSFFYRGNKTTGVNERLGALGASGVAGVPDINLTLDGNWHRGYSTGAVTGLTSSVSFSFGVFYGMANNDTLDVWGFQLQRGSLTDYQKSNWESGTNIHKVYLYRKGLVKGNVLDLTNTTGRNNSSTYDHAADSDFIRAAVDYCQEGERCNIVKLPITNYYLDKPLGQMPRAVSLEGSYSGYRLYGSWNPYETATTTFVITYRDTNRYVMDFEPYGNMDVFDNAGLKNITMIATDSIAGFVRTQEITGCNFENITSSVSSTLGQPYIAKRGWSMEVSPSSDNHYNTFRRVSASSTNSANGVGLYYGGGVGNIFYDCQFTGDTSVHVAGGVFRAEGLSVEGGNYGIKVSNGDAYVDALYSEASAYDGGSTIYMEGLGGLTISNSKLQTDSLQDTLINLVSGSYFNCIDSEIRLAGVPYINPDFPAVAFHNTGSVSELSNYLALTPKQVQEGTVRINGNYATYGNDGALYHNQDGNQLITSSSIQHSDLTNINLIDSIGVSGLTLFGNRTNYVSKSEDHTPDGTFTYFEMYNDHTTAPDGTNTADVIAVHTDNIGGSTFVVDKTFVEPLKVDEIYTVSVWVKGLSSPNPSSELRFRFGIGGTTVSIPVTSGEWTQQYKTVRATVTNTTASFRLNNFYAGDSIAVWGWNVNKGRYPTAYVPTTTTGIIDTVIYIQTKNNAFVEWDNKKIRDTLRVGNSTDTNSPVSIRTAGTVAETYESDGTAVYTQYYNSTVGYGGTNNTEIGLSDEDFYITNKNTSGDILLQHGVSPDLTISDLDEVIANSQFISEEKTTLEKAVVKSSLVQAGSISTNQNNFNVAGLSTTAVVTIDAAAPFDLTGIVAQENGFELLLVNEGTSTITLKPDDANSSAGNRFRNGTDYLLLGGRSVKINYLNVDGGFWFISN